MYQRASRIRHPLGRGTWRAGRERSGGGDVIDAEIVDRREEVNARRGRLVRDPERISREVGHDDYYDAWVKPIASAIELARLSPTLGGFIQKSIG
jgi:hypothetical protein